MILWLSRQTWPDVTLTTADLSEMFIIRAWNERVHVPTSLTCWLVKECNAIDGVSRSNHFSLLLMVVIALLRIYSSCKCFFDDLILWTCCCCCYCIFGIKRRRLNVWVWSGILRLLLKWRDHIDVNHSSFLFKDPLLWGRVSVWIGLPTKVRLLLFFITTCNCHLRLRISGNQGDWLTSNSLLWFLYYLRLVLTWSKSLLLWNLLLPINRLVFGVAATPLLLAHPELLMLHLLLIESWVKRRSRRLLMRLSNYLVRVVVRSWNTPSLVKEGCRGHPTSLTRVHIVDIYAWRSWWWPTCFRLATLSYEAPHLYNTHWLYLFVARYLQDLLNDEVLLLHVAASSNRCCRCCWTKEVCNSWWVVPRI